MAMIATPHGHAIIMSDGSAMVTSPMVANDIANTLCALVEAMSKDLASLTDLKPEEIIEDYYEELELDTLHAAFNAVLRKQGLGKSILPTRTRIIINEKLQNQEENANA